MMVDNNECLNHLSPLVFDEEEAISGLADMIYEVHKKIAKEKSCYEVSLAEMDKRTTLGKIESVLSPAFCSYFGNSPQKRYKDIFDQLCDLTWHLAKAHIFQDGNKRTSLLVLFSLLGSQRIKVTFKDSPEPDRNHYYQWIQDLVSGIRDREKLAEELRSCASIDET